MKTLEISNLKKTFRSNFLIKKYPVLKGIDLSVEQGEIYGFLGPNGAGKTTTIKCILGLLFPDAGEILINSLPGNSIAARSQIGFLPENPYFYDYLNANELLYFTASLFGIPKAVAKERISMLIQQVGLAGREGLKLRKYSKGMLQRLGLAQALIQDPVCLILDEPFSGLDPIGRKEFRDLILGFKAQGKTIFFSSHILQDMEMMVDKVGIIINGRISRQGLLSEMVSSSTRCHEIICARISEKQLAQIPVHFVSRDNQFIITLDNEADINQVVESIIHNNGQVIAVNPVKKTLEDIFLNELREVQ
ncbi:MAG: ABC transporter ATP-binding protein [Candidatus Aminicenantes bacterium]|nr:ABC transporter ATP-binding protein [Candidatus Aminicenantes bacterium]